MGDVKENISKNLSYYMTLNNLNNKELSQLLGVSESTVGKWLLKKSTPRMGMVEKLAAIFNIRKSALLEKNPEAVVSDDPTPIILARDLKDLSPGQINIIRAMVDEFKSSDAKGEENE